MTKLTPDTDSLVLRCDCANVDHLVEFTIDTYPGPSRDSVGLLVRPLLNPCKSFFYRIFVAFNYLFNRTGKYASVHFDTVAISDKESIEALDRLIKRYKAIHKIRAVKGRNYVRGED